MVNMQLLAVTVAVLFMKRLLEIQMGNIGICVGLLQQIDGSLNLLEAQ